MIKPYFLSLFSHEASVDLGKQVWDELDSQLPEAVGIIEDDKPRMEQFTKLLKNLSYQKKKALQTWLEAEIHDLRYNFSELSTASEEEFERKWLQIYNEHLRVLTQKTP